MYDSLEFPLLVTLGPKISTQDSCASKEVYLYADAEVGVDTESGSWETASRGTLARRPVHAAGSETQSTHCKRERRQSGLFHLPCMVTEVENGKFTPSIYKIYSLALIYKCTWAKIMGFFGINLLSAADEQKLVGLPNTQLIGSNLEVASRSLILPLDLRKDVELAKTNLVSRMFEKYGGIPAEFREQLDFKHHLYGYVGLEDYTLYPVIRPGSFVEIDDRENKIKPGNWQNEYERPIYFVELRDGYACAWCQINGNQLTLIPSQQSRTQVRHVRYPAEAGIVGRVSVVTMTLVDPK